MKEIELLNKRKKREKHFLREDGTIIAKIYNEDIHYKKNGKYEEIDNTLIKKKGCYTNTNNDFKVSFNEQGIESLMKISRENDYLDIRLKNSNKSTIKRKKANNKYIENISYNNILDGINIEYKTLPTKIKETIILQNNIYKNLTFIVKTNLNLIEENKTIIAQNNNKTIFTIEKPYMEDSNGNRNNNIFYNIRKVNDNYEIDLVLDKEWLNSKNTKYPIYIDPTITNQNQVTGLYDTYIYPGDTGIDKNNQPILKAGVERVNEQDIVNRTLIKFDLPEIGTGSEVIDASIELIGYIESGNVVDYENYTTPLAEIHKVTKNWDEQNANWNDMHDKYDSRIEALLECPRSSINNYFLSADYSFGNITNLVKKWYCDTPNYGIIIKSVNETYIDDDYPAFFSKNNNIQENSPKPILKVVYRNQNGLENYLDYKSQTFNNGSTYINTYNGNLTSIFDIGRTIGSQLPVNIQLVYNTNDVVLKNKTIYGLGYKLNLTQTIKEITIADTEYLEYQDDDGTIHYFTKDEESNLYKDEDGLNFTIEKTTDKCLMTDKNSNNLIFNNINNTYYLSQITDADKNIIKIERDSNNNIKDVIDKNLYKVSFEYLENKIIVHSPDSITTLNYNNNNLISIDTIDGLTNFTYNNNNLLASITDITGIKIAYEYYEQKPYKVKKVIQYGLNNKIGQSFSLKYGFNTTSIIDNKNRCETLIFNSLGNLLSKNSLYYSEDLNNAYSVVGEYDQTHTNKITSSSIPVKYVKNYLKNTSFEEEKDYFTNSSAVEKNFSEEKTFIGNRSLKIKGSSNQFIEQEIDVEKEKHYTFSGYFINNKEITLSLSYTNNEGKNVISEKTIESSESFIRNDITIYYSSDAITNLKIKISFNSECTTYIDAIQLEEGEIANTYNIIENSDFSSGIADWNVKAYKNYKTEVDASKYFKKIKFNNNQSTALKVEMSPTLYYTKFSKKFPIKGKKGDLYTISFWYKNEGIEPFRQYSGNNVTIYFKPANESLPEYCILPSYNLNINEDIWQYFSYRNTAIEDFSEIEIIFTQNTQANNLYITNLSFFNNITSGDYNYDENGNLISISNQSKEESKFKYDNKNQLLKVTNPKGKEEKYEYDNNKQNRILNTISSSGIYNEIKYDSFGNPVATKISKKSTKELTNNKYKIRSKGTNKYIKAKNKNILVESNECSNTIWNLEKIDDKYKFSHSVLPTYSITHSGNNILLSDNNKNNLFILEKNDNDTYHIKVIEEDPKDNSLRHIKYFKEKDSYIVLEELEEDNSAFEFYIEEINELFIENDATYTEDGRFITSVTDSGLNKTIYETDNVTGLLKSVTDSKGIKTEYTYNNKQQLIKLKTNEKEVDYTYNDKKLLTQIKEENKAYNFLYDDFLNINKVMIGDNITLITNNYEENNGNLLSSTYGNNQQITYSYDNFDRIKTLNKMDDTYNYKYDNNGNIAKILSNNYNEKFNYDISNRIYEYIYNNLKINYTYDSNNNVTSKRYKLDDIVHNIQNKFNSDEYLTKIILDNKEIDYKYDSLGRIINRNIANSYNTKYNYLSNGNRTTDIIKSIEEDNDKYEYTYDNLYNITDIYYNNNLIKHYDYDLYNELIKEYNYDTNKVIEYEYDNSGNILKVNTTDINSNEVLETSNYEYTNANWSDQLTKYNNEVITYDEIGNPTTIGNKTLTWINGRNLETYKDPNKNLDIKYKYDVDGIRVNKIVNGKETKYYLEDDDIIYEQRGNNTIYYLHDLTGLLGLEYNGNTYYYVKNIQDDIIGILNSNYERVVTYEYDSWGKIQSIKDSQENEITDENNIGLINPFRYRGYYYDSETELYYLNSRYYSPKWKRFINADEILGANKDLLSYNLYIYCSNNPITLIDQSGHGLWNKIKKGISKIIKTAQKIKKSIASFIGSIVNINKNKTNQVKETINEQNNIVGSHKTGKYITTTKNIASNDRRNISLEISKNNSITMLGVKYFNSSQSLSIEGNINSRKIVIGQDDNIFSFEAGMRGLDIYFKYSYGAVGQKGHAGLYQEYSINGLFIVTVAIGIQAAGPIIGKGISYIGETISTIGKVLT